MPASENIARTEQCITPPVCHIGTVSHNLTMTKEEGNKYCVIFFFNVLNYIGFVQWEGRQE